MSRRSLCLMSSLILILAVGRAHADHETPGAHTSHPAKTILLDSDHIQPSALTMGTSDLLVFENHSLHPMVITFVEPADLRDKIRCGLVRKKESDKGQAPWTLFAWNDGKLTATVPPGRFASVCSLAKGTYAYTAALRGLQTRESGSGGALPEKGQITVE